MRELYVLWLKATSRERPFKAFVFFIAIPTTLLVGFICALLGSLIASVTDTDPLIGIVGGLFIVLIPIMAIAFVVGGWLLQSKLRYKRALARWRGQRLKKK